MTTHRRRKSRATEWIDATAAMAILQLTRPAFHDLVEQGLIGKRTLPNTYHRFHKGDCISLARIINRPAATAPVNDLGIST